MKYSIMINFGSSKSIGCVFCIIPTDEQREKWEVNEAKLRPLLADNNGHADQDGDDDDDDDDCIQKFLESLTRASLHAKKIQSEDPNIDWQHALEEGLVEEVADGQLGRT